ncbi:MAG: right-handed parallel beta-helix repeat-containing protein [Kiritimatiellia bacterium]
MKRTLLACCAAATLAVVGGELVVEPNGLSPQGALESIRAAKARGDKAAWTVRVKPGHYALKETLVVTPADSGTPEAPVTWVGEGEAVFAGGERIGGWTDAGGGVWRAPIPKAPNGEPAYFEQLWVNGRRAARARLPNTGYFNIRRPTVAPDGAVKGRYLEHATITNAEVAALARLPKDEMPYAQMCVIHKWSFARRILRGVTAADGMAGLCVETWSPFSWTGWQVWNEKETLVHFENVRSAFDAPGEWFYDAKAGEVLYRPLPGEEMARAVVVAPNAKLSQLVAFRGDPEKGAYVHDVTFRNIGFAYSDATATGGNGPTESWQHQAASRSDGAVTLAGARRVAFEGCRVRNTGNYALRFNDGCTSNRVVNCTLEELGAGGVWMGAGAGHVAKGEALTRRVIRTLAPRATAFNLIDNCTIRGGGRFNPEGTGVAYTHVSDSKVLHCEIHDFFYTGVSVGWTWGFAGSVAQRNEIAFNKIYDLGKGIMSDMGGVYTLGTSYGTTVHDNVIHDVWSYSYGGWALYTDEGSEGIVMERNLCWNTTDGGFHQHYGAGCVIRNNIFAWNRKLGAVRMARQVVQGVPCTLHFVNNIVLVREGPLVGRGPRGVGGVWANNLWWDASGRPELDGLDWAQWAACGKETGGRYADPQFENAEAGDFRLKAGSPAFALGFKAWDFGPAGLRR